MYDAVEVDVRQEAGKDAQAENSEGIYVLVCHVTVAPVGVTAASVGVVATPAHSIRRKCLVAGVLHLELGEAEDSVS